MRVRVAVVVALAAWAGCSATAPPVSPPTQLAAPACRSRTFVVHYVAKVPGVAPRARRLDVWLPIPQSDAQQRISGLSVSTDLPHELRTESTYGNAVLRAWNERPEPGTIEVAFSCTRLEERALPEGTTAAVSREPAPDPRDLEPDRLGLIDDPIRQTARRLTVQKRDTIAKARAIYDYVIRHMAYDKAAPGWGNGDTRRACRVGRGNCTDFHALFISLARAAGIPARFGIGFPLPCGKQAGTIAGYHCWAEFWVADMGWVPVDCSEAWKHPELRQFYFGNLDPDRFRLTVGRDVRLPGMKGGPLNYFLNPYAETDGKPAGALTPQISFCCDGTAAG